MKDCRLNRVGGGVESRIFFWTVEYTNLEFKKEFKTRDRSLGIFSIFKIITWSRHWMKLLKELVQTKKWRAALEYCNVKRKMKNQQGGWEGTVSEEGATPECGVLVESIFRRKGWSPVPDAVDRSSKMRTEGWSLDFATWRSLVTLFRDILVVCWGRKPDCSGFNRELEKDWRQ